MNRNLLGTAFLLCMGLLFPAVLSAQAIIIISPHPHPRPHPLPQPVPTPDFKVRSVEMQARVRDQVAEVQISQVFQNTSSQQVEASLFFPVPDDASLSGLTLMVDGKELPGKLMKKEEARRIYEDIVRSRKDPALLEYMGQGLYRTNVFPVPPQGERTVEIRYSQLLRKEAGLISLLLPIGTAKHSARPVEKLNVTVRIEAADPIKTIYSPTHKADIERSDEKRAVAKIELKDVSQPDDFRLLYGTQEGLLGINVLSYRPEEKEDGYFLLLASPEVKSEASKPIDKTVVFVVDRSGSMSGKKFEQAREALKYVIRQLNSGDTFNIVAYDSSVESFRPELQRADEDSKKAALGFVEGLFAGGSTNIDGALQTALGMLQDSSRPSYVLFLTDGLPTVGELDEQTIAKNADKANKVKARLFSFGVGFDVNSRLLDRLSREQRGASVFVRPNEDIEAAVSGLYNKIGSPMMTDLKLTYEFDTKREESAPEPINRTYPRTLPDLFRGEQLVLVGRYKQDGPAKVTLQGSIGDEKRSFTFPATFKEKSADESNGFIEKLWATRRIGEIIDELDLKGQNQELIDELVQLSIKHGILTPYTSFLADERTELAARESNRKRAMESARLGLETTDGVSGFVQRRFKGQLQSAAQAPSSRMTFNDAAEAGNANADELRREVSTVRQLGQKTFFRRDNRWRDSTVTPEQEKKAVRIEQFSREYFDLAAKHGGTLSKYLAFEEPLLVNLAGTTYLIEPPKEQ